MMALQTRIASHARTCTRRRMFSSFDARVCSVLILFILCLIVHCMYNNSTQIELTTHGARWYHGTVQLVHTAVRHATNYRNLLMAITYVQVRGEPGAGWARRSSSRRWRAMLRCSRWH